MKKMLLFFLTFLIMLCSWSSAFAEDQIGGIKPEDAKKVEFDMNIIKDLQAKKMLYIKPGLLTEGYSPKHGTYIKMPAETWAAIADMANFVEAQSQGKYIVYVSCLFGQHASNLGSNHWDGTAVDFCVCKKNSPGYNAEVCNEKGTYRSDYDPEFHQAMIMKLQGCGCDEIIDHYTGMFYHYNPPAYVASMHASDSGGSGVISNGHFHLTTTGYSGGMITTDWLKGIYEIGKDVTEMMEDLVSYMGKAMKEIQKNAVPIFFIMAVIDLALTTMLAGFEINPFTLVVKMLKYGFFLFLIQNWGMIANEFFVALPSSVAESMAETGTGVMNITQPHLILQKALAIIAPGLNYATRTYFSPASALVSVFISLVALFTMFAVLIFTIYIAITYVEFYIAIALNIIMLPFSVFGFTKFAAMGGMNYVWKCTVKMMVLALITGLIGGAFEAVDLNAIITAMGGNADNPIMTIVGDITGVNALKVLWMFACVATNVFILVWFGWRSTGKISKALSGNFEW